MKKLSTLLATILIVYNVFAQAPFRLSYQAVIRNSTGGLVVSHDVGLKISILQGSASGTAVYVETHTTTTNTNGLATIEIGGGTLVSGNFSTITWGAGTYFLKTETDPSGGTSYTITGTSQLLSVPYALYSKTSEGLKLPFAGNLEYDGWPLSVTNTKGAIYGKSTTSTGSVTAIKGESASESGVGVFGVNTATSGINSGVYGTANSGYGVRGYGTIGVTGTSDRADGRGSEGINSSTSGSTAYGVYGVTMSAQGTAVYGKAAGTSDINYGVFGETLSPYGYGVYGKAGSTVSGTSYGVYGLSSSASGYGVKGIGGRTGVSGESETGTGVSGVSSSGSGDGIGVWALTKAASGTGLRAIADSPSGTNYGVYSTTASSAGFSGYFSGGKFYINGRAGIRTTAPEAGLHLKGAGFPESFLFIQSNATGQDAGIRLYEGTTAKWHIFNNAAAGGLQIYNSNVRTAIFCEQATSNVGIGRTDPGFDLDVLGNIRATGAVYYGSSPATMYNRPDYVFEDHYNVLRTEDVEKFLEKENHLPWITSVEEERQENGDVINMTRMAFETVETVENLQLQIIEQNKLIRELEARLKKLEAKRRR